jgi:hypothetical protein
MNPDYNIGRFIASPLARKVIYGTYVIAGIVFGAIQVGTAAVEGAGQPEWLTVALAVYAFLSVPVGSLALTNTPAQDVPAE